MKLQTVRDFIKRGIGTDFLMVQEYTYFLDWVLTLGMFIPCDEDNIPVQFDYPDYQKRVDLLVFKGFKIDKVNFEKGTVTIHNKAGMKLEFNDQDGIIWDVTYDTPTEVKIVSDLMIHEPVLNYAW